MFVLKDFEDKDFEDVLKRPVFCPRALHDKEILKYYCKNVILPFAKLVSLSITINTMWSIWN